MIVVAHPDDEVIGAGAQLGRFERLTLIHVTDGAPRNMEDARAAGFAARRDYARARRRELLGALALIRLPRFLAHQFGVADQEASLRMVELAQALAAWLEKLKPEVVITHPYEGGHPDHDATAFAVHAARRLLEERGTLVPALVEMTSYHEGSGRRTTFEFLPGPDLPVTTLVLSSAQRALKRKLLACFVSQRAVLADFPVEIERFRAAPAYDFTKAPHEGRLYYERFELGMDGSRWRALARDALATLFPATSGS